MCLTLSCLQQKEHFKHKDHEVISRRSQRMNREENFKLVLDCAFQVHSELGPGLLESAYEECLCYELRNARLKIERQKTLPLKYKEIKLDAGYRIDIMVEDSIIIELKAIEELTDAHLAQVLTYLKLSNCKLGLLANFNVKYLKNGIKRVIL